MKIQKFYRTYIKLRKIRFYIKKIILKNRAIYKI